MMGVVVIIVKWHTSSLAFSGGNPPAQNIIFLLSCPVFHSCSRSMWCCIRIWL